MPQFLGRCSGKMRSMYGPERLLLASKKPYIQDLIEKSKKMTEEEILGLKEKPDVIKGLIMIKRKMNDEHAQVRAERIADAMMAVSISKI